MSKAIRYENIARKCYRCGHHPKRTEEVPVYTYVRINKNHHPFCPDCIADIKAEKATRPTGGEMVFCQRCQFVEGLKTAIQDDWQVDLKSGIVLCAWCKDFWKRGDILPIRLSCLTKTQQKVKPTMRWEVFLEWAQVLTVVLLAISIGKLSQGLILLSVFACITVAFARRSARAMAAHRPESEKGLK